MASFLFQSDADIAECAGYFCLHPSQNYPSFVKLILLLNSNDIYINI